MNDPYSDFITDTHTATTELMASVDKPPLLNKERIALDMVNQVTSDDFASANAGLDAAAISVITTSPGAIENLHSQGLTTNLYKVKF